MSAQTATQAPSTYIGATDLADLLHNGALFASTDRTLPVLNAIQLTRKGATLTAVATDRYILGIATATVTDDSPDDDWSLLIDRDDCKRIIAAVKSLRNIPVILTTESDGQSNDWLSVNAYESMTKVRAVDGQFPKYEVLIPTEDPEHGPVRIAFTPSFLAVFGKLKVPEDGGRKIHPTPVRFTMGANNKPMRWTIGEHLSGILMPVRISG